MPALHWPIWCNERHNADEPPPTFILHRHEPIRRCNIGPSVGGFMMYKFCQQKCWKYLYELFALSRHKFYVCGY